MFRLYIKIALAFFVQAFLVIAYSQGDIAFDFFLRDDLLVERGGAEDNLSKAFAKFAIISNKLHSGLKLNDADAATLLNILQVDPEARLPLAFLISYWLDKNEPKALLERLLPIANKNPSSDSIALAVSLAYARLEQIDESINFLEGTFDAIEQKEDYSYGINYVELVIHLSELYLKKEEFRKCEELFERALKKKELQDNFKLRRAAFIFFANKAEDRPFSLFSGWLERRFYRKMLREFSYIEKLWLDRLTSDLSEESSTEIRAFELAPMIGACKKFSLIERIENLMLEKILDDLKNTEALIVFAAFQNDIGQSASSRRLWKKLCEENKSNYKLYTEYGRAALASKKFDEAIHAFEWAEFIAKGKEKELAAYMTALAYVDARQYEKAISKFDKLKTMPEAHYFKAVCYKRLNDNLKAAKILDEAEKIAIEQSKSNFLNLEFYLFKAFVNDKAKRYDIVMAVLENLYSQYPDNHEVCNYYGYFLADHNKNLDKAEDALKEAIKREPDNAAYLDSMAWLYFRQGRYQEAYDFIIKAINNMTENFDGLIYDHAGDIAFALNKNEEALEFWQTALELYSEDTNPEEIQKKKEKLKTSIGK